MPCITKKIFCYTAITTILNLSFQPAYAVKIELLNDVQVEENHSYSRPLMKEDPAAETIKASAPAAQAWMPEIIKEAGSYSFSALKGLMQLPRLASKGIIYTVKHPLQALTLGLAAQVTTAAALNSRRDQTTIGFSGKPSVASLTNGNMFVAWDDSGDNVLSGQIFSPIGTPIGTEFPINPITTSTTKH